MSSIDYDVVVVGAGVSGLYSGWLLKDTGLNVLVIEGRDRIAGRQWTYRSSDIGYADMGAAFVGKTQTRIMKLLKSLDIETYKVYEGLKSVMSLKSGTATYSSSEMPYKKLLALLDLNSIFRKLDTMSKQVPIDCPWEAASAAKWDSMSLEQFFDNSLWTQEARTLVKMFVVLLSGGKESDLSLLSLLHDVKLCGGLQASLASSGGLQEFKILGGSSTLSEKMAEKIQGSILLNKFVNKISEIEGGVEVTTSDGTAYKTKKVIVTIPLPAITNIQFSPELPQYMQKLSNVKSTCHNTKTFMYYETAFWREHGLNGQLVSEEGIIVMAMDDTKPDGTHPAIMGFATPASASLSLEERKKLISEQYASEFGLEEFLSPINYIEKNWQDEDSQKHGKGCCMWSLPPGVLTDVRKLSSPNQPAGNVYFAGTESALTFRGYMEGALRSGHYAASQVCSSLGKDFSYPDGEFNEEVPYMEIDAIQKYLPNVPVCIALIVIIIVVLLAVIIGLIVFFTI